jgi:hypothetical protein
MISTTAEIAQVGTISANGEKEIGELIARAMEKVRVVGGGRGHGAIKHGNERWGMGHSLGQGPESHLAVAGWGPPTELHVKGVFVWTMRRRVHSLKRAFM